MPNSNISIGEIMDFKETSINQCKDQVHALYVGCEHGHEFNWNEFNEKIVSLWKAVQFDGISQSEFYNIVQEVVPSHEEFEKVCFPFQHAA